MKIANRFKTFFTRNSKLIKRAIDLLETDFFQVIKPPDNYHVFIKALESMYNVGNKNSTKYCNS